MIPLLAALLAPETVDVAVIGSGGLGAWDYSTPRGQSNFQLDMWQAQHKRRRAANKSVLWQKILG